MKEAGSKEVGAAKARAIKSYAMGRISKSDQDYIVVRLDQVQERINDMEEEDADGYPE